MSSVDNHFALLLGFVESGRARVVVNLRPTPPKDRKFLFWNVFQLPYVFGAALGTMVWVFGGFWLGLAAGVVAAAMCYQTLLSARAGFEGNDRSVSLSTFERLLARSREDKNALLDLFHDGVVSFEDTAGGRSDAAGRGWIEFVKSVRASDTENRGRPDV